MNQASPVPDSYEMPPVRRPGIAVGIALSLLLHGLLIFGYRIRVPAGPPLGTPAQPMTVWLRPVLPAKPIAPPQPPSPPTQARVEPPPKPLPKTHVRKKPEDELRAAQSTPPAPANSSAVAPRAPQSITVPSQASQQPDPFHPEQGPKKFDMEAALKTARKVANEPDPARANLPVAQLDKKPLYPESHETQLSRDIQDAKRPDCKNTGAGLLSPLIWLMDKKDSGCKW